MQSRLTDAQRELAQAVHDFLAKECTADDVRRAWTDGPSRDRWRGLAEMGVLDIASSFGLLEAVAVLRECGYAGLPEPVVETTVATWCGVDVGARIVTCGFDRLVPHAAAADVLLLADGNALHLVARADIDVTPHTSVDGARPVHTVRWSPSGATRIDGDASAAYDVGVLGTAAFLVGVGNRLVDMAVEHAKVRQQFGRPIGSFQAVKHALADALVSLEFAWPLVLRGAMLPSHVHASAAKANASSSAMRAARVALQVHGAIGYTFEHDLHLWFKRAYVLASAWGDAAHHREQVARAVLDPSPGRWHGALTAPRLTPD